MKFNALIIVLFMHITPSYTMDQTEDSDDQADEQTTELQSQSDAPQGSYGLYHWFDVNGNKRCYVVEWPIGKVVSLDTRLPVVLRAHFVNGDVARLKVPVTKK